MEDHIGIMIYGYDLDDALKIQAAIEGALENPLFVISASGNENRLVAEILDKGPEDLYEDKDAKIVMFLGFNEGQVKASLKDFPSLEVTRPIFCSLTAHNIRWPMKQLIEHLQEEHRQWTQKGPQSHEEA